MERETFKNFQEIILKESGISLSDEKMPLLSSRIGKRMRTLSLTTPDAYLQFVKDSPGGEELNHLIDAISTNVTHFFREPEHFDFFTKALKAWEHEGRSEIRLWCAAASSGEEPYSLAITASESLKAARMKMLATDICVPVLNQAVEGVYREQQFRITSEAVRKRYFHPVAGDASSCQVDKSLKKQILFKRLNLAVFPYPLQGPFDAIFCRNVMIYFDQDLKQKILDEVHRLLRPGGYFFVSRSENLLGIKHSLKTVDVSVYQLPEEKR